MWIIDTDLIGDRQRDGRLFAVRNAAAIDRLQHLWRVKDDDGEVYAIGRSDNDSSFAPLDWYQTDAGATSIEYFDPITSRWVTL